MRLKWLWEGAVFRGLKSKVDFSISKAPGAVSRDNTVISVCQLWFDVSLGFALAFAPFHQHVYFYLFCHLNSRLSDALPRFLFPPPVAYKLLFTHFPTSLTLPTLCKINTSLLPQFLKGNFPIEMEGVVIKCLSKHYIVPKLLSDKCEEEIKVIIKESQKDIRQDPVLYNVCKVGRDDMNSNL